MGDDHVAVGAGALVEAGAVADRERLGHVDLDVVDVVAVPDRLEHAVGEPEREDVLDGLLAEEVVDPEDALLVEDAVQRGVELARRLEVVAERLLDDDARASARCRPTGQRLGDGVERLRRYGELVEQAATRSPAVDVWLGDVARAASRRPWIGDVEAAVEPLVDVLRRSTAELLDRAGVLAEVVVGPVARRRADDRHGQLAGGSRW